MKKLTFTFTVTLMSTIVLCTVPVQGMEKLDPSLSERIYNQLSELASIIWTPNQHAQQELITEEYKHLTLEAEKHNQHNPLFMIHDALGDIFYQCHESNKDQVKSLENSIKNFMSISRVCKKLNILLTFEAIGNFCKDYTQEDKNKVLQNLIKTTRWNKYAKMRVPALIVIHAGADVNTRFDSTLPSMAALALCFKKR